MIKLNSLLKKIRSSKPVSLQQIKELYEYILYLKNNNKLHDREAAYKICDGTIFITNEQLKTSNITTVKLEKIKNIQDIASDLELEKKYSGFSSSKRLEMWGFIENLIKQL